MGRGASSAIRLPAGQRTNINANGIPTSALDNAAWSKAYFARRNELRDDLDTVVATEHKVHDYLTEALLATAPAIARGFEFASFTLPHWIAAACPEDRGSHPTGTAVHWAEVAEHAVLPDVLSWLRGKVPHTWYAALPACSDGVLGSDNWLLQCDTKAAGPTENKDDLVVSPNQLSGDGRLKTAPNYGENSVAENAALSFYTRAGTPRLEEYQPLLAPFYLSDLEGKPLITVTSFIKVVYDVTTRGQQPPHYLELATFPNGLLTAEGGRYDVDTLKLFKAGKDDKTVKRHRRRVRIDLRSLALLDDWRVTRVEYHDGIWQKVTRV